MEYIWVIPHLPFTILPTGHPVRAPGPRYSQELLELCGTTALHLVPKLHQLEEHRQSRPWILGKIAQQKSPLLLYKAFEEVGGKLKKV